MDVERGQHAEAEDLRTVICIPYRGEEDGPRGRNLNYVLWYYNRFGLEISLGDSGDEPFNRAASRNAAADAAGDWDVAVFVDADCVIPQKLLEFGIEQAFYTGRMTIPHDRLLGLTREGTELALVEPVINRWDPEWTFEPFRKRKRPSGVIIIPRSVWDILGGYDERFAGWGYEDAAILRAAETLCDGWDRIPGKLWHLWHPSGRGDHRPSEADLWTKYQSAAGDPEAFRVLLGERDKARLHPMEAH